MKETNNHGKGGTTHNKRLIRLVVAVLCLYLFSYCWLPPVALTTGQTPSPKAAIVDHLSITQPNPAFVSECTALLKQAGFTIDYYKGEEVTVEFYRNLPSHSYNLIVLRVHSASNPKYGFLNIATSEPYSKRKYIYEQLSNQIWACACPPYRKDNPVYFAITHKFVKSSMKGRFNDTVIIMMGCSGLKYNMPQAFLEKGAKVYISWSGPILAPQTDQAALALLRKYLIERKTIEQTVSEAVREIGKNLPYRSKLYFFPSEAGNYRFLPR